jgi:hypothetical protein
MARVVINRETILRTWALGARLQVMRDLRYCGQEMPDWFWLVRCEAATGWVAWNVWPLLTLPAPRTVPQDCRFCRSESQHLHVRNRTEARCRGRLKLADGSIPIDSYDPNFTQVELMEPNGNAQANSQNANQFRSDTDIVSRLDTVSLVAGMATFLQPRARTALRVGPSATVYCSEARNLHPLWSPGYASFCRASR